MVTGDAFLHGFLFILLYVEEIRNDCIDYVATDTTELWVGNFSHPQGPVLPDVEQINKTLYFSDITCGCNLACEAKVLFKVKLWKIANDYTI